MTDRMTKSRGCAVAGVVIKPARTAHAAGSRAFDARFIAHSARRAAKRHTAYATIADRAHSRIEHVRGPVTLTRRVDTVHRVSARHGPGSFTAVCSQRRPQPSRAVELLRFMLAARARAAAFALFSSPYRTLFAYRTPRDLSVMHVVNIKK